MTGVSVASLPSPPTRTSWSTFCRAHRSGVRCDSGEKIHKVEGRDQKGTCQLRTISTGQILVPESQDALGLFARPDGKVTAVARVMPCSAHCESSHLLGQGSSSDRSRRSTRYIWVAISVDACILTSIWRKPMPGKPIWSRSARSSSSVEQQRLAEHPTPQCCPGVR